MKAINKRRNCTANFPSKGRRTDWTNIQQMIFTKRPIFDIKDVDGNLDQKIPAGSFKKFWTWKSTKKINAFFGISAIRNRIEGKNQELFNLRVLYKFKTVNYCLDKSFKAVVFENEKFEYRDKSFLKALFANFRFLPKILILMQERIIIYEVKNFSSISKLCRWRPWWKN